MSASPSNPDAKAQPPAPNRAERWLAAMGAPLLAGLGYLGGVAVLVNQALAITVRSLLLRQTRFGRRAYSSQLVRVGVRSIAVIVLVCAAIGLILALQMAPTLNTFGQTPLVANIVAIAVVRELGPLITAIVLTGFAGASIAAELGTMVVGEEIEALQAHALNPVRFLVVPRVLATVTATLLLCVIGEWIALAAGFSVGTLLLDIPPQIYMDNTINQLSLSDYFTGLMKAGAFGLIIGAIACYNGLGVTGGAAGVGRATTHTVVHSILTIIFADLVFTAVFYRLGWT